MFVPGPLDAQLSVWCRWERGSAATQPAAPPTPPARLSPILRARGDTLAGMLHCQAALLHPGYPDSPGSSSSPAAAGPSPGPGPGPGPGLPAVSGAGKVC